MGTAESHVDSAQYVSVLLHSTPAATLIQVSGELDLGSVHHLEDCLTRALAKWRRSSDSCRPGQCVLHRLRRLRTVDKGGRPASKTDG